MYTRIATTNITIIYVSLYFIGKVVMKKLVRLNRNQHIEDVQEKSVNQTDN